MSTLQVKFKSLKSCFVNIPLDWANAIEAKYGIKGCIVLKLSKDESPFQVYVGWSGGISQPPGIASIPKNFAEKELASQPTIEIDPEYSRAIGLSENEKVIVEHIDSVQKCVSVEMVPENFDDWEMIELNAERIELNLLSQVRVVSESQPILFWLNDSVRIKLYASDGNPSGKVLMLDNDTELAVVPKVRNKKKQVVKNEQDAYNPELPSIHLFKISYTNDTGGIYATFSALDVKKLDGSDCKRGATSPVLDSNPQHELNLSDGFPVVISAISGASGSTKDISNASAFAPQQSVSTQTSTQNLNQSQNLNSEKPSIGVWAISSINVQPGVIVLNKDFANANKLKLGQLVKAEKKQAKTWTELEKLQVIVTSSSDLQSDTKNIFCDIAKSTSHKIMVLSNGLVVPGVFSRNFTDENSDSLPGGSSNPGSEKNANDLLFFIKNKTEDSIAKIEQNTNKNQGTNEANSSSELILVDSSSKSFEKFINSVKFKASAKQNTDDDKRGWPVVGVDGFVSEVIFGIEDKMISSMGGKIGGLLVSGPSGCGKSKILQRLLEAVSRFPLLTYSCFVSCSTLAETRSKSKAQLAERLEQIAVRCYLNAPFVLFLDDLDILLPVTESRNQNSTDTLVITSKLQEISSNTANSCGVIVASAKSRESMDTQLFNSGILENTFEVPPLGKSERVEILQAIAKHSIIKPSEDINYSSISYLTDGYTPGDLSTLYNRAVDEATVRFFDSDEYGTSQAQAQGQGQSQSSFSDLLIEQEDLETAISNYTPQQLRGITLHKSGVKWSDIGSLHDVRRQLLETLELPSKYAALFAPPAPVATVSGKSGATNKSKKAGSGLRLRSGILLYGYPGCGKTMLASAVANECGLNFISVKGPELLNKYIGQSEQSVRDMFSRAKAAKPCVLFFDEFDSIAPKRGHDNTGVTDRVVNQFLTEMDGAEGLDGVYVLAATSRPDLIDSALLRPGRLDKSLLCDMPDEDGRLDILKKHGSKMNISSQVDLQSYAKQLENFSGADLQAFLYSAFLDSITETPLGTPGSGTDTEQSQLNRDLLVLFGSEGHTKTAEFNENLERILSSYNNNGASLNSGNSDISADGIPNVKRFNIPEITHKHLAAAISDTSPSLNAAERTKFDKIYEEFVGERDGTKKKDITQQRATLG